MNTALHGANGIHKGNLLKCSIAYPNTNFPSIIYSFKSFLKKRKSIKEEEEELVNNYFFA